MQAYLAAHDEFVRWVDSLAQVPAAGEVEQRLRVLALCAAMRGMTSTHWTFVVDGLVAHVSRRMPGDVLMAGYVARGFDFCSRWHDIEQEVRPRRGRTRAKAKPA